MLACVAWARADTSAPPPGDHKEPASVQGYGRTDANCLEWSNGCVLCTRAAEHSHCSTPGIACTPRPTTCSRSGTP